VTLRLNAFSEYTSEVPSAGEVTSANYLITQAVARGILVNMDIHSWNTTVLNTPTAQNHYTDYVDNCMATFPDHIERWMIMNEPNKPNIPISYISGLVDHVHALHPTMPISVRFMGSTSYTSSETQSIDSKVDFVCRNAYWESGGYWDPLGGSSTGEDAMLNAREVGKQLWITEFGYHNDDDEDQADYIARFVAWAKANGLDAVYAWVCQPRNGSSEDYNLWNDDYTVRDAFLELDNDAPPAAWLGTIDNVTDPGAVDNVGAGDILSINGVLTAP